MNWQSVLQSVVEGTTTALVWAGLLWIINRILNFRTERKLRKTLSRIGTSCGPEGFGVNIKNDTDLEVVIRDVTLFTTVEGKGFGLPFIDKSTEFTFQEKPFKDPRQFEIVMHSPLPKPIVLTTDPVVLPPHTGGRWMADNRLFMEHPAMIPTKCHVGLVYKNLFGRPKILVVESNPKNADFMREQFQKHVENVKKGVKGH